MKRPGQRRASLPAALVAAAAVAVAASGCASQSHHHTLTSRPFDRPRAAAPISIAAVGITCKATSA